ncbi:uncharacterized protein YdeI (YjbR/CyaY-like superfamily) [Kordia periserrulae]|uniref:Uncharacterized protein YdeI (YjbR/CyaY-like superfamily) n=1 Tax=Kordia periserrulae TaxID=701523 RepID=A0A2T6C3U4_9FLAO|nr:DUF1801 domain-containing protein [Kordia periserrulae]PTX62999.1 uncharacterized protein YdeI (YjbR/CyaY-like superfamily) [Kordia periserrulae]
MKKFTSVEQYIQNFPEWEEKLRLLQRIMLDNAHVTETLKWNIPVYTVNGKNVLGIGTFKTHVAIWFFHGALLNDEANVLVNAQEGKTQAMRHWKFAAADEIPVDLVKNYVNEAVQNQLKDKTVAFKSSQTVEIPAVLASALSENDKLKAAFEALSNYKQKEYIEHIASAKRDVTKQNRLDKSIPMILAGKGLNDKYR